MIRSHGTVTDDGENLTLTPSSDFAIFSLELHRAVQATFPGFGYMSTEISRFLSLNAEPYEDTHYLLYEGNQVVAVAMGCGDHLEYVVPSLWEGRYEVVRQAILLLKKAHPTLQIRISEDPPSHSAWYAALLPAIGFEMTPRVRMIAATAGLRGVALREVVAPYRTVPMEPKWLDGTIAMYLDAFQLPDHRANEKAANLRESLESPDRLDSWTLALRGDAVVGACFGSHHRGRLFIEELAVSEGHRKRGLGRNLLIECVGKLAMRFPDAETVVLDVDRVNVPAVQLYTILGFSPQARYTVAR